MDLGVQFFTAAKAQHESGAKWSLIVLVVLLYFHLAIVAPFAQQTADKAAIEHDLARNQASESELAPIVDSAASFVAAVESQLEEASSGLREDLIEGFRVLDERIWRLADMTPEQARGEEGAQLFVERRSQQQQQAQQVAAPDGAPATVAPMPAPLRGLVAEEARSHRAPPHYAEEMERYISAAVVAPAFQRANDAWAKDRVRPLGGSAAQLDAQIAVALTKAGSSADKIRELQAAVGALRQEAQRLRFAPPADSDWWRSVAGKDSSIRAMVDAMTRGVGRIGEQHNILKAAQEKASAAVADNRKRAEEVAVRLAELEQQAKDLQAQLGEIGQPLKVISLRLSVLAPLLPLVIAIAIAALTLWRAESLRRMTFAASLVGNDAEGSVLRRWLAAAAGGTVRLLAAREIALGAIAIAWVAAAALAVRALPAPLMSAGVLVGIALTLVAASRAYHWYQCNQALAAADRR